MKPDLPIDATLPDLITALRVSGCAVLQAPPGAGKTTRVPLAILEAGLTARRIIMLEPRRLATRAAAERMAQTLNEEVGQTVGYRMRGDTKTSRTTRIEVVTEGILTRMIQSDPDLPSVGALIFDEFHERSLNADLGLALAWESREALREDLMILVMSATLDAEPVAEMLNHAPMITSKGRSFPVETRWLNRPLDKSIRFEAAMAAQIRQALEETDGSILAFLPGEREIKRTANLLGDLGTDIAVHPLFGALPFAKQRAAVAATNRGRKVVLSTAIAETALTIQDVRVVIDGGKSRRARFDPARGMSKLVTERVTKAEAVQRQGRAGRVAPGICYRLWSKGEEGGLFEFPPPEIASADLSDLVLELAVWGVTTPDDLAFLTRPPKTAWNEAQGLLHKLCALDDRGHITPHGRALAAFPLHPRLAHMLSVAGPDSALLAALLADRDPLRGVGTDLMLRMDALREPKHHLAARGGLQRISAEAKRLRKLVKTAPERKHTIAEQAALAYPDRIGLRRKGDAARWVLSGGSGAMMEAHELLANTRLIVACDLDGDGREARVRQAIALNESELRSLYGNQITWVNVCIWSKRERKVLARRQERFGALVLSDYRWDDAPAEATATAMLEGVRELGVPWSPAAHRLRARIELLREQGSDLPDCSDTGLLENLEHWLLPFVGKASSADDLKSLDLTQALKTRLGWEAEQLVNQLAPSHFTTPLGRKVPIDYSSGQPEISVKLQELFGVTVHPVIGTKRLPLKVTLLSPGQKPVQVTMDIPGFWDSSYADVRKDMRGRYPRHPWPQDPTLADPSLRAKPRGT